MSGWKADGERGALPRPAGGVDAAAHGLDQVLDDRQTQAGAAQFARTRLVHAVEAFKDAWQIGLGNANAGVGHFQAYLLPLAPPTHRDSATLGRVFDGVVEQVIEDLLQGFLVRPDRQRLVAARRYHLEDLSLGFGARAMPLHACLNNFANWERLKLKQLFAGFDAGEAEQVE